MDSLDSLARRIRTATALQSVVKTMKVLAAVNIRQYEQVAAAIDEYYQTIELAFQVLFRVRPEASRVRLSPARRQGLLVLGSDHGMCGPLNEAVASHATQSWSQRGWTRDSGTVWAVGSRIDSKLAGMGWPPDRVFAVPAAVSQITPTVQAIALHLEAWRGDEPYEIHVYLARARPSMGFAPHHRRVLPLSRQQLTRLAERPWPTKTLPTHAGDWQQLYSRLVRQYVFVALHRSLAESLVSENAARLKAMQSAEHNMDEMLADLSFDYHQSRQSAITSELLDVVSGFEALS